MSRGNALVENVVQRPAVAMRGRRFLFAAAAVVTFTIASFGGTSVSSAAGEHVDPSDTKGALDLAGVSFKQTGPELRIAIRMHHRVPSTALPGGKRGTLCATLAWGTPVRAQRRYCIIAAGHGSTAVNVDRLAPKTGKIVSRKLRRISSHRGALFVIRFQPAALGLPIGRVFYSVRSSWHVGSGCRATPGACVDDMPMHGSYAGRVYRAVPAGCQRSSGQVFNGPRRRKVVALTFDDGPSTFTQGYLNALHAEHARATFFQIGQQVPGRGAIERAILGGGNAIGNHSYTHPNLAGGGAFARSQLTRTSAAITTATGGYHTCFFRPPYGSTSSSLVSVGSSLGLKSIIWDVDTEDWKQPGTAAIISRAVGGTHPGSIVLMHDGGGPRGGTQAAIRPIIRTLRARGYGFVTIPQLLGLKTTWRLSTR